MIVLFRQDAFPECVTPSLAQRAGSVFLFLKTFFPASFGLIVGFAVFRIIVLDAFPYLAELFAFQLVPGVVQIPFMNWFVTCFVFSSEDRAFFHDRGFFQGRMFAGIELYVLYVSGSVFRIFPFLFVDLCNGDCAVRFALFDCDNLARFFVAFISSKVAVSGLVDLSYGRFLLAFLGCFCAGVFLCHVVLFAVTSSNPCGRG